MTFYFYLFIFLAVLCSLWDVSSPTKDGTLARLQWKHGVLTAGLPRNSREAFQCWYSHSLVFLLCQYVLSADPICNQGFKCQLYIDNSQIYSLQPRTLRSPCPKQFTFATSKFFMAGKSGNLMYLNFVYDKISRLL